MKKIFSLFVALMAVLAINATDYYYAGDANGWSNNSESWKFVEENGVLTLHVADLYGGFKITENGSWHPQHGFNNGQAGLSQVGGSVTLVKCDDSNGDADTESNASFDFSAYGEDYRCRDAVLTFNPATEVLTLVSGTMYDHSAAPATYQLVGACTDNWSTAAAIQFEEVNGVLTVNVPDLNGTFKIIKNREWNPQWATNWTTGGGLALGVPYVMGMKGAEGTSGDPANLALANPFYGYRNAVLTLTGEEENFTLTLVSGELYVVEADWHMPGSKAGWNCDATTKMEPVAGQANTFEFPMAEFGKDFKVVYGVWAVEFGAPKGETFNWVVNTPMTLVTPCDNVTAEDNDVVLTDVNAVIVVDYDNASVVLTLEVEGSALEQIAAQPGAQKIIENGRVIILKDGFRYTAAGQKL